MRSRHVAPYYGSDPDFLISSNTHWAKGDGCLRGLVVYENCAARVYRVVDLW